MQFISKSLDAISTNYSNDLKNTKLCLPEEAWKLISQKGVFPYNYLDSYEKLNETFLPDIKEFNDNLKMEKCKLDDYQRAFNVWKIM